MYIINDKLNQFVAFEPFGFTTNLLFFSLLVAPRIPSFSDESGTHRIAGFSNRIGRRSYQVWMSYWSETRTDVGSRWQICGIFAKKKIITKSANQDPSCAQIPCRWWHVGILQCIYHTKLTGSARKDAIRSCAKGCRAWLCNWCCIILGLGWMGWV